jgi:hypothetical protein
VDGAEVEAYGTDSFNARPSWDVTDSASDEDDEHRSVRYGLEGMNIGADQEGGATTTNRAEGGATSRAPRRASSRRATVEDPSYGSPAFNTRSKNRGMATRSMLKKGKKVEQSYMFCCGCVRNLCFNLCVLLICVLWMADLVFFVFVRVFCLMMIQCRVYMLWVHYFAMLRVGTMFL